jgi:hypothetical protein
VGRSPSFASDVTMRCAGRADAALFLAWTSGQLGDEQPPAAGLRVTLGPRRSSRWGVFSPSSCPRRPRRTVAWLMTAEREAMELARPIAEGLAPGTPDRSPWALDLPRFQDRGKPMRASVPGSCHLREGGGSE